MTNTTRYAVIQVETSTVYGIGRTAAAAERDAKRANVDVDGLITVPCTAAAAAYVDRNGGSPSAALTVSGRGVSLREEE